MSELKWDLDELVRKIMADLRNSSVETSAAKASAALTRDFNSLYSQRAAESGDGKESGEEFYISDRIIVVDVVKRAAESTAAKKWRARRDAIVTPAAQDELKKLGVTLTLEQSQRPTRTTLSASNYAGAASSSDSAPAAAQNENNAGTVRVLIATHLPDAERFPVSIYEYLTRNADTTEFRASCLKETSKHIAEEIAKDKSLRVVLATHDAAIGSVWTNRFSGVRAVVAFSADQAKRDIAAADANVAIVDPHELGSYPLRQIVDFFIHR